jgi:YVTN family beta-propeller protein
MLCRVRFGFRRNRAFTAVGPYAERVGRLVVAIVFIGACRAAGATKAGAERDAAPAVVPAKAAVLETPDAAPVAKQAHPDMGPPPPLEVQEVEETGRNPKGVVLSNDGTTLFVTNFGELERKRTITMYDAETLASRGQIDVPAVVVESVISPDDRTLYVSSFWGHSVLFVDVASRGVTHEVKTGYHPKVLALGKDGKSLFAANWSGESITQIDVASATVVRTLKVGKNPRGLVVASDGTVYAASFYSESIDVFSGPELATRRTLKVCKCPRHLALSPDEKTLYVSCLFRSQLHAIDPETGAVLHQVPLGDSPKSIAVSRDGRYVYSADYGLTRSISVVDTSDWTQRVYPVPGMDRGSGVVVLPDGEHAVVTGWYDAHVYKIGFVGTGGHPTEAKAKIARWQHRPFSKDPGDDAPH